ncbi:MAG: RluA family pseudouridine synthase [Nitrospiraceae bacterium]|nr:MAG: RluA family pseudouridine synthase [Nitrospiraceae bacterium]
MAVYQIKNSSSLIDYLTSLGLTRIKIKQLVRHRAVEVNGKSVKALDHPLHKGDTVSVSRGRKEPEAARSHGMRIVYEDDAVIVIEKPAGLLTIASETEKKKTAYYQVNEYLKQKAPRAEERIFIVHRLDRDTSGLVLFAKNEKVKRLLQDNWKDVEKRYYAIVEGTPAKKEGEIISRLSETKSLRVYSDPYSEEAKIARTKYRVIRQGSEYSLLDILLETGRKNQIRVHLADIGHPVAGDKKYGARTNPFRRLGLHAYLLSFRHPLNRSPMLFESRMPDRWSGLQLSEVRD